MHNKTTLKTFQHRIIRWRLLLTVNSLPTRNNIDFRDVSVYRPTKRQKEIFESSQKSKIIFKISCLLCQLAWSGNIVKSQTQVKRLCWILRKFLKIVPPNSTP